MGLGFFFFNKKRETEVVLIVMGFKRILSEQDYYVCLGCVVYVWICNLGRSQVSIYAK